MVQRISVKQLQIDKSNTTTVLVMAAASFMVIFSLVASRALLNQRSYQGRVITAKKEALDQLKSNNEAAVKLVDSYKTFVGAQTNIIDGTLDGTSDRDGDNAKIVLDALPSKYDFPALAASLEKILADKNYPVNNMTGIDDELTQSAATNVTTQPVEIPFEVGVSGNFDTIQGLLDIFQRSIRPIKVNQLKFAADNNDLKLSVTALTYYQPEKIIRHVTEVIK